MIDFWLVLGKCPLHVEVIAPSSRSAVVLRFSNQLLPVIRLFCGTSPIPPSPRFVVNTGTIYRRYTDPVDFFCSYWWSFILHINFVKRDEDTIVWASLYHSHVIVFFCGFHENGERFVHLHGSLCMNAGLISARFGHLGFRHDELSLVLMPYAASSRMVWGAYSRSSATVSITHFLRR